MPSFDDAPASDRPQSRVVETEAPKIDPMNAALADHLEHRFREQARDEGWAATKEREVREFFASQSQAEGSRLLAADCRATMCRVRIAHDEPDAGDRFLEAAGHVAPFEAAGARFPDPDPSRSVVYLARRGTRLPWPSTEHEPPAKTPSVEEGE